MAQLVECHQSNVMLPLLVFVGMIATSQVNQNYVSTINVTWHLYSVDKIEFGLFQKIYF